MTKHAPALLLTSVAVLAGCSELPPQPRDRDSSQARYVDATTLTSGDEYFGVEVITSVPLHHITAVDAETRLREDLPQGVRVGHVGESKHLLIQGPAEDVVEAINLLRKLDVL